jgi:predicted nucleotide-binding protein (sugar kinase/HSP70/actin superfamily)
MISKTITIGIPKALLYYKYEDLWDNFFHELGCDIIHSPDTNNEILENGKNLSIDESCLSLKLYLGHVNYLVDKADYILVPRISSLHKKEKMCTNFMALYDIVHNLFDVPILKYNIDVENGESEKKAFLKMGKQLKKSHKETYQAYMKAKRIEKRNNKHKLIKQYHIIETTNKIKVLLVAHSYNTYDKLVGEPIIKYLKELNVEIIYANIFNVDDNKNKYKEISPRLYWTYNKDLLGSIIQYQDQVDGIILLSVFPCGPDSLTNEMCIHKVSKPITLLIIDELKGEAGLQTRIESFIDIIKEQKKV